MATSRRGDRRVLRHDPRDRGGSGRHRSATRIRTRSPRELRLRRDVERPLRAALLGARSTSRYSRSRRRGRRRLATNGRNESPGSAEPPRSSSSTRLIPPPSSTRFRLGAPSADGTASGALQRSRDDCAALHNPSYLLVLRRAGDEDRTRIASLEGWSSAIELHPRCSPRSYRFAVPPIGKTSRIRMRRRSP